MQKKTVFNMVEAKSPWFMLALKECFVLFHFGFFFILNMGLDYSVLENDCLFLDCVCSCSGSYPHKSGSGRSEMSGTM